jgi:hypothetical protein
VSTAHLQIAFEESAVFERASVMELIRHRLADIAASRI